MEEKPYKFENPKNPRLVTNIEKPFEKIYYVAGGLWLGSMYLYTKNVFRIYKRPVPLLLFTLGSALASYEYADYFMSSPIIEAGLMNNERELQKST